jgi:chromosome segregation ATPase
MDFTFFEEVKGRVQYLSGVYKNRQDQFKAVDQNVRELKSDNEILQKTEQVLKHLVDKLVQNDLQKMDKLITYGLNTVYPGKDLRFESHIDEYRGKVRIPLKTIYNGEEVGTSSRSSVTVVESFLLRILCIIKLKKAPLLLMDETFPAVDSGYMENVSKLIAQLCEKLNLDVLAVTHNQGLSESAHSSFRLTSKKNTVEIEKIR